MEHITHVKTFKIGQNEYSAIVILLENATSIYLYDDTPKIGTISLSVPASSIMPASTLHVSGSKNQLFVQMVGERIATKTQKLALISLNIKDASGELVSSIIEKIEREILDKQQDNKKK